MRSHRATGRVTGAGTGTGTETGRLSMREMEMDRESARTSARKLCSEICCHSEGKTKHTTKRTYKTKDPARNPVPLPVRTIPKYVCILDVLGNMTDWRTKHPARRREGGIVGRPYAKTCNLATRSHVESQGESGDRGCLEGFEAGGACYKCKRNVKNFQLPSSGISFAIWMASIPGMKNFCSKTISRSSPNHFSFAVRTINS